MSTATQSNPKSATSFADMVDYATLYANLDKQGIHLTDEEKQTCERIMGDRLRNHDAGRGIGNSLGALPQYIGYLLLAVYQNFMAFLNGSKDSIVDKIDATITTTSEQGKLHQLHLATAEAYSLLKRQGGNLAKAAPFITNQMYASEPGELPDMQGSVFDQVAASINLPKNTNVSLDAGRAAIQDDTISGLPANLGVSRQSTQGLTARG